MRKKWILFLAPPAFVIFIAIGGALVLYLWNWLLPPLFGWPPITYWQALGLLALCRILFGGFGAHGVRSNVRRRVDERLERMTPAERERLREGLHHRWGDEAPPDSKPTT